MKKSIRNVINNSSHDVSGWEPPIQPPSPPTGPPIQPPMGPPDRPLNVPPAPKEPDIDQPEPEPGTDSPIR